jgi:hypothetical protein
MSASDDTTHCTQFRTAKLYNKKEIVSIIEEYSIPGNVVTQPLNV